MVLLTAIASRKADVQEQFPGVTIFQQPEDLMRSGLVDAVLVATPHAQHPVIGMQAFARYPLEHRGESGAAAQEAHLFLIHHFCERIDAEFA